MSKPITIKRVLGFVFITIAFLLVMSQLFQAIDFLQNVAILIGEVNGDMDAYETTKAFTSNILSLIFIFLSLMLGRVGLKWTKGEMS